MAYRHIYCDRTELVLMVSTKKKYKTLNVHYDQIIRIQFDSCTELKFFFPISSEKISIMTSKRSEPIVYTKLKEKKYFDEYKKELEKFAKDNRITFINNCVLNNR